MQSDMLVIASGKRNINDKPGISGSAHLLVKAKKI
jgi:hypothetical protein